MHELVETATVEGRRRDLIEDLEGSLANADVALDLFGHHVVDRFVEQAQSGERNVLVDPFEYDEDAAAEHAELGDNGGQIEVLLVSFDRMKLRGLFLAGVRGARTVGGEAVRNSLEKIGEMIQERVAVELARSRKDFHSLLPAREDLVVMITDQRCADLGVVFRCS